MTMVSDWIGLFFATSLLFIFWLLGYATGYLTGKEKKEG